MKQIILNNIDLSSQVIVFDQQTHQGQLQITNKHDTLGVVFKIKTTKLNVIDVKPAKGFIKPQSKLVISFKLSQKVSSEQMQSLQRNDKFLLQFLNITNKQVSRQFIQQIWKAFKNNTANLQYGYGCYKVFMNLTGKRQSYNSNGKSQMSSSKMSQTGYKSIVGQRQSLSKSKNSNFERQSVNDHQLATKYQQLKQKQLQLGVKRQNIFMSKSSVKKSSPGGGLKPKHLVIIIILFLLAFLTGNYVRSGMVKVKPIQTKKQQTFFSSWYHN